MFTSRLETNLTVLRSNLKTPTAIYKNLFINVSRLDELLTPDTILCAYGKIWTYRRHRFIDATTPYASTSLPENFRQVITEQPVNHFQETFLRLQKMFSKEIPHQQMLNSSHTLKLEQDHTLQLDHNIPEKVKIEVPPITHQHNFSFPTLEPILKAFAIGIDKVRAELPKAPDSTTWISMIQTTIGLCSCIWSLTYCTDIKQALGIINTFIFAAHLPEHILDICAGFYAILTTLREEFTPEQQGKNDGKPEYVPHDNVFWSIIRVIRSMFSWQTEKEMELSHHTLKRFMSYTTFLKKTKDFFSYIFLQIKEAFQYLYQWKTGVPWAPKQTQELCVKINDFTMRVMKVAKYYSETRKEANIDYSKFYEVQNLLFQGEALAQEVTLLEGFKQNVTHFNTSLTSLNTLYNELKQDKRVSAGRSPSFNTWLCGKPGVGKSTLLALIPAFHAEVEQLPFNANWLWVRTLGEDFWSGYRNQRFCFMDDITAVADPLQASKNFFEFMMASGEIPYALPMPDLGSKGTTYFTSEDIILTSMDDHIPDKKSMGLTSREGITRRVDLFVEVRVKGQKPGDISVIDYGKPLDVNRYEFRIGDPNKELNPFDQSKVYDFIDLMGEYFTKKILKKGGATSAITSLVNYPGLLAPVRHEFMERWGGRLAKCHDTVKKIQDDYLEQIAQDKKKIQEKERPKSPPTPMEGGKTPDQQCNDDACPHFRKRSECSTLSDDEYHQLDVLLTASRQRPTFEAGKHKLLFSEMITQLKTHLEAAQKQTEDYLLRILRESKKRTVFHYIIDALVIASGIVGLIHLLKGPLEPVQQSLGHYLKYRQLPKTPAKPLKPPQIVPLQQMSETYLAIVENVLGPNTALISTLTDHGKLRQANCTFIGGHMFYCPGHFFTLAYSGAPVEFETSKGRFTVPRSKLKLSHLKEQDVCFGVIDDLTTPTFKMILHHFITENDSTMETGGNIMLVTRSPKNTLLTMMMTNAKKQDEHIVRNILGEIEMCQRVIGGKIPTSVGDCGASYVVVNDQWVHKIIAMHTMGTGVKGWGTILTQETIKTAFKDLLPAQQTKEVRILPYDRLTSQTQLPEEIKDNITILGTVDPPYHIPTKNPIIPSPLCGLFTEPKEYPTIMKTMYKTDGTKIDPAVQMFNKLNRPSKCNAKLEILDEIARCMVNSFPEEFEYRLLSDWEILNGVRGRSELKPVVITASAGYPFNTQHLGKGKTPFIFRGEDGFLHYTEWFHNYFDNWRYRLEHDYENLRNEPQSVAFCYFLKQERVDPKKIWEYRPLTQKELESHSRKIHKILSSGEQLTREPLLDLRGIAAAHLCVFLTMRQYFGALVINRVSGQETDHCKIGINPHSYDWKRLYTRACTYGPERIRAGDCKKYDSSVKYEVSSRVWHAYNEKYKQHPTYKPQDGIIRQRLHDLIHRPLLVLREILFTTKGGNQSGQLLTTVENGDTLFMEIVYCIWDHCVENNIPITIEEIIEILILADFGDDDFFTLPEFLDAFTTIVFAQKLKDNFDMDYVSADKSSPLKPLYNIDEITFLCRRFVDIPAWCFAPTEIDVIDDSLNWCDPSKVGIQKAMESNAETACYEYWQHGEDLYNQRQFALNEAMKELGWKQFNKTWDQILDERMQGLTDPQLRQYAVPDIPIQQSKEQQKEQQISWLETQITCIDPTIKLDAPEQDMTAEQIQKIQKFIATLSDDRRTKILQQIFGDGIPNQQSCTGDHPHPPAVHQVNRFEQQCDMLNYFTNVYMIQQGPIAIQLDSPMWHPYPSMQSNRFTHLLESNPCNVIMRDWAKCTFDEDLDIPIQQSKEVPFLMLGNTKWILDSEVVGTPSDMTILETMVNDYINRKKMAVGCSEKRKAQTYKKLQERLEEIKDFADAHGITYTNKQHPELDNLPKQQSVEYPSGSPYGFIDQHDEWDIDDSLNQEHDDLVHDYIVCKWINRTSPCNQNKQQLQQSLFELKKFQKDNYITYWHKDHPEIESQIPYQQSKEEATVPSNIASAPAPQPMDTTNKQENQTVTSPSATQATITGTFGDNTAHEMPAMTQTEPIVAMNPADDPYDDQGIGIVISREYEVDTITWSYSDATGTFLWSGFFPDLLLAIPNIVEKLDRFQYLRAGVRVTFRINGVVLHFGCLMITALPHFNASANVDRYFQTIYTASNLGPHFLSPNTNTTVDVLIPFVAPSRFQNLKDTATEEGFIGTVAAHVLAPLTLEGAVSTPELKISVFAHFEIPKAAGLGLRTDTLRERKIYSKIKNMIEKRRQEKKGKDLDAEDDDDFIFLKKVIPHQQSKEQDVKSEKKTQSSKYAGKAKEKTQSIIRPIAAEATDILGFLSEIKGALMDKPTDVQGITKVRIDPQSGLALADGLDHAEPLSLIPENKVAYDTSMYGQDRDYNLFTNYKLLPSLVFLSTWTGAQPKGTKLMSLPITPAFVHKYQQVIEDDTFNYFDVTHIANLTQYFRWWRGGMKILIKMFASKFTSGRVVLKWLPDPTFSGSIANEEFGDTIFHMIDVTGDTDYCHTTPWLRERTWEIVPEMLDVEYGNITSWDGINGQLIMEVSNPLTISNASASPIVYFAVFWAGAEDFDVARPREPRYDDGSINAVEARQSKHRKKRIPEQQSADVDVTKTTDAKFLFQSVFPSMVPARLTAEKHVSMGETVESWTQLFRRYTIVKRDVLTTASAYTSVWEPYGDNLNDIQPLQRALRCFHYKRGSFRVKALVHYTATVVEVTARNFYANIADPSDWGMPGITWTVTSIRPWVEFQIPFYYQYDMVCNSNFTKEHTTYPAAIIVLNNYQASTTVFACELLWYGSLGDDFSLGWPASPVPLRQIVPLKKKTT